MTRTSPDKAKIKVLLLESIHSSAVEAFRRDGYTSVEQHLKSLPEARLLPAHRDACLIGIRSAAHLRAKVSVAELAGQYLQTKAKIGCVVTDVDR